MFAGATDGSMYLYVDGKKVVSKHGMKLRGSSDQKIDYLLFHNFLAAAPATGPRPRTRCGQ